MSLMSSIFGDATSSKNADKQRDECSTSDLFSSKNIPLPQISNSNLIKSKSKKSTKSANKKADAEEASTKEPRSSDDSSVDSSKPSQSSEDHTKGSGHIAEQESEKDSESKSEKRLDEEKRTIFVGNLPPDTTRKSLAAIFKQCGSVASARLRSVAVAGVKLPPDQAGNQNLMRKVCINTGKTLSDTPKKSAQGYVVFESISSVEKALKLNNSIQKSHTIRVDHATPTIESSRSVFVGNLPYGADEDSLREHFLRSLGEVDSNEPNNDEDATVSSVRIIRDKETQKCKGFGYVTLRDASVVPLALQLHGSTYMRRELRVLVSGKRFKGKRGDNSLTNNTHGRSFEGQRATPTSNESAKKDTSLGKRKFSTPGESSGISKQKKRRSRSEKKSSKGPGNAASKSGLSKRAATERKVDKRVKKLKQRAAKGMGKKKK